MKLALLRRMHKMLGIFAGLGMLWLSLTGLVILWADNLDLPRSPAPNWIVEAYGISSPDIHLVSDGHVLDYDGRWKFDGHVLVLALHAPSQLLPGPDNMYYAIADNGIAIIAPDGALVDSVSALALGVHRLTRAGGNARVICAGDASFRCTTDSAEWKSGENFADLPALLPITAAKETLSMERLLLDLHAGRFLGPANKILWTLFGIAMLILPWSGLRLALRIRHNPKKNNRKPVRAAQEDSRKNLKDIHHTE